MSNAKSKQAKPKTGLARCMELASDRKGLVFLAAVLSSLAAIASFIPYIAVYFMIRSIIGVFPNLDQLDMGMVMNYGWLALAGIVANILLYFLAIFSSHMAAFGTLYELKVLFADHITKIPLGYHLTIGSGRLRKIMDENIESVEGFIAHQFPDFVASITAPIVMVIILLAVDWRFGLASLVGIILAFVAEFIGFGSREMKENMGKYQKALEEMNNAESLLTQKEGVLSGNIRISAPSDFGRQYLSPALLDFSRLHPAVKSSVYLGENVEDLVANRLDMSIRFGNLPDSSLVVKNIRPNHRVLVASASYLRAAGTPDTIEDLHRHR